MANIQVKQEPKEEDSSDGDFADYVDLINELPTSREDLTSLLSDLSGFIRDLQKHDIIKEGREFTTPADGSRNRLAVVEGYNWKVSRKVFDAGPIMEIFQKNNLQEGVHYNIVDGQPVPLVPSVGKNQAHNIGTNITGLRTNPLSKSDEFKIDPAEWFENILGAVGRDMESLRSQVQLLRRGEGERSVRLRATLTSLRNTLTGKNTAVKTFETKPVGLHAESTSTESPSPTQASRRATTTAAAADLPGQLGHKRGLENLEPRDNTTPPTKKLRVDHEDSAILK